MTDKENNEEALSRRRFIKNTGMVAGGVVGGSLLGGFFTNQFQTEEKAPVTSDQPEKLHYARMFFSRQEDFAILAAATERIFPKDDNGPGAIELEVPYFIDKQLAGYWGLNGKSYMKGPFYQNKQTHDYQHKNPDQDQSGPNTDTQAPTPIPRHQSRLNRGEIFMQGIRRMDELSQKNFDKKFVDLDDSEKDNILQEFEKGDIKMNGVASVTFFHLLKQTTLEGAYADPVYGGNKNMLGWKMKEYPGPRMGFTNEIEEESFLKKKQKSLRDYQS